jgi:hypothetical protein
MPIRSKKASGIAIRKKKKEIRERNKRRREAIEPLENVNDNEENGVILVGEDKSSLNVFNDKESDALNILARKYGKLLTQQSDRNLPRTYFPSGITGDKKKNGHEMQGVILNILFIFLSVEFTRLRDQFGGLEIGTKRIGQWILLLERLIMVEEFLKQKSFVKKDVKLFKKWFPNLLHLFKHVVDRQASTKLKLLKFHLCTHFAGDILKWGLPSAYNSSTGESNHKMLKRRSKKTQKRLEFFEEQTGVRYVEQLALKRSIDHSINLGFQHHSISSVGLEHQDVSYRGYSFFLNRNGIFETSNAKEKKQRPGIIKLYKMRYMS